MTEIIQSMLSKHNETKLENRNKFGKFKNMLKLKYALINSQWEK